MGEFGKTVSLVMSLDERIFNKGKVVVLDSGFCVLKFIIAPKKMGVSLSAPVKKRRHWPSHVKGDKIKEKMMNLDVGIIRRLPGELDVESFDLFFLKETDYGILLMSTYGFILPIPVHRDIARIVNEKIITCKCNSVVGNNYGYRAAAYANKAKRNE